MTHAMRHRALPQLIFVLTLLLFGVQWHSGFHSTSYHLPIGEHAEQLTKEPSQKTATDWLDVCDLCSAQFVANTRHILLLPQLTRFIYSLPITLQLHISAVRGMAQPRAPPFH